MPPWRTSGRDIENGRLVVEVLLPKRRAELDKLYPKVGRLIFGLYTRFKKGNFFFVFTGGLYSPGSTAVARTSPWTSSSNAGPAILGSMGVKSASRYQSTIVNRFRPMVFVPIPADKYQAIYIVFYLIV
jgi:hypothetical protein